MRCRFGGGKKRLNNAALLLPAFCRLQPEGIMSVLRSIRKYTSRALIILVLPGLVTAQVLGIGREYTEMTRLRPAQVHLANQTIMVQVSAIDASAAGMTERLKKLITNRIIGVNKNMREVNKDPYYKV